MKKLLLFSVALGISVGLMAQPSPNKLKPGLQSHSAILQNYDDVNVMNTPSVVNVQPRPSFKGTSEITVIDMGTAANAYGLYNGGRTALWAEPEINTIIFAHRMAANPGSGFLAYDVSTDGGATWSVNNQVFDPNAGGTAAARYPQGVIYNPSGNTNPDNAYVSVFAPTLDGSNAGAGSWGGYAAASEKLDGTELVQEGWPTVFPYRQNVPDGMTINPVTGDIFVTDPSKVEGLGDQYVDSIIITRGVFNPEISTWEYEQSLLYAPALVPEASVAMGETRIAFAPDGMIGYILTLSDNGDDEMANGLAFYPILYKTTDGGLTWDETPISVPLGGPDGLDGVINDLLTDEQIASLFEAPVPNRDEIVYTTAFTCDLAIDNNGNPVISIVIGVAGSDPYSIVSETGFFASYNIYSTDQGTTWVADKLGDNLITFRGDFGEISEDNRSQITTSRDGTKMFFSWLDTDFGDVLDNIQPDIFCIAWDVTTNEYSELFNVTYLSDAWLQAYMGTASYYALPLNDSTYMVPFVYQQMEPSDPTLEVQFKFIKDFTFTFAVGVPKLDVNVAKIHQNYPNPFTETTQIKVDLTKNAVVSLDVHNMIGQKVYSILPSSMVKGTNVLTIDANSLKPGIYTYSVFVDGARYTNKMIIE